MLHDWFMYFVFVNLGLYTVHFYPEKLESAECRFHSKFDRIKAADLKTPEAGSCYSIQYTFSSKNEYAR